jgi:hypothetical protein
MNANFRLTLAMVAVLALSACNSSKTTPSNNQAAATQPANPPAAAPAPTPPQTSTPAGSPATAQPGTPSSPAPSAAPPAPPPPTVIVLPASTHIRVRLDQDLGSKISQPGQSFPATIASDVVVNGETIIPRGARAEGTVVDAKPLGAFKGGALLSVRLDRVHTRWGSYPVSTAAIDQVEQGKGKRTAGFIGGGAGLGALLGGIAGGGKGAAIGALAGGGAGTAGGALTGNKQIVLPAETLLTFRLQHPVHITAEN